MKSTNGEESRQVTDDMMSDNSASEQSKVTEIDDSIDSNNNNEMTEPLSEDNLSETLEHSPTTLTNQRTSGRKRIPNTKFSQPEWTNEAEWQEHITFQ